ncbi:hypothetical protein AB0I84_21045 [Streptomyces spectabilis]|uniref:hypothetical protein n=1 Tax=Streptomyces spectabilis TaxID=68270 RepID=UPI0033D43C00
MSAPVPREQDRELAELVTGAHGTLKDFPIAPGALLSLPITIDKITDPEGAASPPAERQVLAAELTMRVSGRVVARSSTSPWKAAASPVTLRST